MCGLTNIVGCVREPAGLGVQIYVIESSRLTSTPKTIKEKAPAPTGGGAYVEMPGDSVIYADQFSLLTTDDKFAVLTGVVDHGMVETKSIGEIGFSAVTNTLKMMVSSTSDGRWLTIIAPMPNLRPSFTIR